MRSPKPPRESKLIRWNYQTPTGAVLSVKACTKGEARRLLADSIGLPRLPAGAVLVREEKP